MVAEAGSAMTPLIVGFSVMALGIALMFWHWSQWKEMIRTARTVRDVRYGDNQFRRRVLIGSLMAIVGSLLISLRWASDYRVFTGTIVLLLALLMGILALALLDLVNVLVRLRIKPPTREARARLLEEYRQRRAADKDDETPSKS
jgi:hypothetical protein